MTEDQERFELAAYEHYLTERNKRPIKDDCDVPLTREGLLWRQPSGDYGVLMFNAAWWAWRTRAALASPASAEGAMWRCFHCDEAFADHDAAREHFGRSEYYDPACQINIAEYRRMEAEVQRYREEDTDLHRAIHAAQSDGFERARRAEEKGYARGLSDAQKHPADLGLQPIAAPSEPSVPVGWKLVPVEPTQEMIDAYDSTNPEDFWVTLPAQADGCTRRQRDGDSVIYYQAMLAASPRSQPQSPHQRQRR